MTEIEPEVVRKLQQYAGVKQTGVFDEETIGMMVTPRCQNPDIMDESNSLTRFFLGEERSRRKRAAGWSPPKWEKLDLTFSFENTTPQNTQAREVISSAFAAWEECSKLSFTKVDFTASPDIKVKFASWRHDPPADCSFDGPEGVKAHAFYPPLGLAHFDEDEDWSDDCVLYSVALHEIGHLLGLGHSFHKTSIMFAYFNSEFVKGRCDKGNTRPLAIQDIDNIRSLYGWENCDKAEDPEPTVEPTASEGPGALDVSTSSSSTTPNPTEGNQETSSSTTPEQKTTNTFSGSVLATFATDGPNNWKLSCGEMEENMLSSPYYPEIYPNGMNCTWTIVVPPGMKAVSMHFIRFELENGGEECLFDYFQITEEDGTSHKFCGLHTESLTFESRVLTLNFVSDTLKQAAGFKILFIYEAEPQKPPCRAVLEDAEGVVTQNHSELDDHEECIYQINSSDPNKQILIIIDDVADHCSKYQLLQSEDDGEESLIGSCSEVGTGVKHFISTSGTFFIKFRPQESGSFAIKYYKISSNGWEGCSSTGIRDYNNEFLESGSWQPHTDTDYMYFPNTDCVLYIPRNDKGTEQIVEIDFLSIEFDKNCNYDFVEVYTSEDNGPQRYCGERETIEFSTLGDTLIYFHSDGEVEDSGLMLSYRGYECAYELDNSRNLIGNDVSLEGDCSYQFGLNQKSFACFDFSSTVNGNGGCNGNVEVVDNDSDGVKYCDSFSKVVNGDVVHVSQGVENHGLGYVAIDSARDCYKQIAVTLNRDKSFSFRPPKNKKCLMHFVTQPGSYLVFSFFSVNLRRRCPTEHIQIFQGNKGCSGGRKICRNEYNIKVESNEAFVLSYMTDRKSFYRLRVRQERERGKQESSVCPDSCNKDPTEGPTAEMHTASTSTPENQDMGENGYNRDHIEGSRFGGLPGRGMDRGPGRG